MINTRVVIEPIQLRRGGDLQQVLVTRLVFGEEKKMIGGTVEPGIAISHAARRHVGFHANDGFDPGILRRLVKIDHPKHGAVVGDCHGRHVQFLHTLDQLLNVREAIEHGVFRVNVEMGKRHIGCVVGELDSPVVRGTMKLPNYITVEPAAIIARMFKRKEGAWLKIFRDRFILRKACSPACFLEGDELKQSVSMSI